MKIIEIERRYGDTLHADTPQLTIRPASTVIRPGMPFFIPVFTPQWCATPTIAFRLCRLGKAIDPIFTGRYVDAIAPMIEFLPTITAHGAPLDGFTAAVDATVAIGQWQHFNPGNNQTLTWRGSEINLNIDLSELISTISRHITIQMGDAIVPFRLDCPADITEGDVVNLTLNGETPPLSVRIK